MTSETVSVYKRDPDFKTAMDLLQQGKWQNGLAKLDSLIEAYPLEQDLRALKQDMLIRARIDNEEEDYNQRQRMRKVLRATVIVLAIGAFTAFLYWGIVNYSQVIEQQWAGVRQNFESQLQDFELTVKYRDAQSYIQAGKAEPAIALLNEIYVADPDFPGLEQALSQAENISSLNAQYEHAKQLLAEGERTQAMELLEEIAKTDPYFEDVPLLLQDLEDQIYLEERFEKAEEAYQNKDWTAAATQYETLRAIDPTYQTEIVEERLFNSYINAAQSELNNEEDLIAALNSAEDYYRKALALKPQNPELKQNQEQTRQAISTRLYKENMSAAQAVLANEPYSLEALNSAVVFYDRAIKLIPEDPTALRERDLIRSYIKAQENFITRNWDEAIQNLEAVYEQEPDYANGTARQTLYDAYMARGDAFYASGEYEIALEDYRRAAVIAEETPEGVLILLEAKLKVAEVLGILGEYEDAVSIYRDAMGLGEFITYIQEEDPELASDLSTAERYAELRYFRSSYGLYRDTLSGGKLLYALIDHVVKHGEYLPLIALRYNTTVKAILEANGLVNPDVTEGQEIVIPVLPDRELED